MSTEAWLTVVADGAVVHTDTGDSRFVSELKGVADEIGDVRHLSAEVDLVVGDDAALLHVKHLGGRVPRAQRLAKNAVQLQKP